MIDKERISQEIDCLNSRVKDTEDAIRDYKKRITNLRQQRNSLRKELLKNLQLFWGCGVEERAEEMIEEKEYIKANKKEKKR